jgi:hypothetical protein
MDNLIIWMNMNKIEWDKLINDVTFFTAIKWNKKEGR